MKKVTQREANSVARKKGYGTAAEIRYHASYPAAGTVVEHTPYGYRKYTTGEYVPKTYLKNFGWKNTYYQHAITVVGFHISRRPTGNDCND